MKWNCKTHPCLKTALVINKPYMCKKERKKERNNTFIHFQSFICFRSIWSYRNLSAEFLFVSLSPIISMKIWETGGKMTLLWDRDSGLIMSLFFSGFKEELDIEIGRAFVFLWGGSRRRWVGMSLLLKFVINIMRVPYFILFFKPPCRV